MSDLAECLPDAFLLRIQLALHTSKEQFGVREHTIRVDVCALHQAFDLVRTTGQRSVTLSVKGGYVSHRAFIYLRLTACFNSFLFCRPITHFVNMNSNPVR